METKSIVIWSTLFILAIFIMLVVYQQVGFQIEPNGIITVTQDPTTTLYGSFGRQKVSTSTVIFESKQINNNNPDTWYSSPSGSFTYDQARASSYITTTAGEYGVYTRQTYRSFDYRPGRGQVIMMSAVLLRDTPKGTYGVSIGIGQYDDNNGIFFRYVNNTLNAVIRSSITGSAVDFSTPQNEWNIDKMDGKGPSGLTLDLTKIQIFYIEYGWLGADHVRWCFLINGVVIPVHQQLHGNVTDGVYMSTPNNPLRFQVFATPDAKSITTEHICSSVSTEGQLVDESTIGYSFPPSYIYNVDNDEQDYVLQAFRLKTNYSTTVVPVDIVVNNIDTTADQDIVWKLWLVPPDVVGSTPFNDNLSTWNAHLNSSLEVYEAPESPTVANRYISDTSGCTVLASGFAGSNYLGLGSDSGTSTILSTNLLLIGRDPVGLSSSDNSSQVLVITATALRGSTIDVTCNFSWKEL